MTQSTESPSRLTPEHRWLIGFALTVAIIFMLSFIVVAVINTQYELHEVKILLQNLRDKPVDTSGVTYSEMHDLIYEVKSIEHFVRTTPLVECGNKSGRTK
jgi:hypothetical protein